MEKSLTRLLSDTSKEIVIVIARGHIEDIKELMCYILSFKGSQIKHF